MNSCLITGGAGNLACQLNWTLSARFKRIVLLDIATGPICSVAANAEFEQGDLLNPNQVEKPFVRVQFSIIIHLASLLSGSCERGRSRALQVNINGSFALLQAALRNNQPTVLFASSVAAFGGHLPGVLSDDTQQWPDSLYGVTKMALERLGVYYHRDHGLDFRCLRLPITESRHAPTGAASALASQAFIEALRKREFTFRSRLETRLSLIYIGDVHRAFVELLTARAVQLSQQVYNMAAMSVTTQEIAEAIKYRLPDATPRFEPDESVAALLASWPGKIDNSSARRDWGWRPEFGLERTADAFLAELQREFRQDSQ